jgi:hypothetical protein
MAARSVHIVLVSLALACSPSSDLDAHARGSAPASGGEGPVEGPPVAPPAAAEPSSVPVAAVAVGGENAPGAAPLLPPVVTEGSNDVVDAGADAALGPALPGADAAVPDPSQPPVEPPILVEPAPPTPPAFAAPLPDDLIDAPVAGEIIFSDEAEWEVDGVFEPTFEIRTPSASYWVVKPLGTIVSIEDAQTDGDQWIAFSSGFRPLRGVPSFPTPPATRVTTVRDLDSQTPTHVRLTVVSDDALWQWVWDFYVTHVTFTINRAPAAYAFAYQGVPGGVLGAEDRLVASDGTAQAARSSFNGDLAGPVEWAYLADTTLGRSLFAIQHQDDALAERYVVRDNDTSLLSFGNGQIQTVPMRFSLGLIRSTNHAAVSGRVDFVSGAIR